LLPALNVTPLILQKALLYPANRCSIWQGSHIGLTGNIAANTEVEK